MKYLTQRLDKTIKLFASFTRYSLIILFITSCTDKKQIAEPIVVEPIIEEVIEPETLFTNTIVSDIDTTDPSYTPPEIIKLSYDKGLDLMLVDTRFQTWDYDISELRKDPTVFDNGGEAHGFYMATYWDTNAQTYYVVTNIYDWSPITNQSFEYTIDEQKQYEAVFYPMMKEVFAETKAPLLYIGSISPLERVYLDPTNQEYYIKYLEPFDTSIYTVYVDSVKTTNTNILPIFPAYDSFFSKYGIPFIYYTNSQRDRFSGIDPVAPMSKEN